MNNPEIGSTWIHKNGSTYTVLLLSNLNSGRLDEYPPTVVYQRLNDLTVWNRPIALWYQSMTQLHDAT